MIDRHYSFRDDEVRLRQLQRVAKNDRKFLDTASVLMITIASVSVITNFIVGRSVGILPVTFVLLFVQMISIGLFFVTDKYDFLLSRIVLMEYVTYYAFIVLALSPDYILMFYAMFAFPAFAFVAAGSGEGIFWSLVMSTLILGGAFVEGRESNFTVVPLDNILLAIGQVILIVIFTYIIDVVARKYAHQLLDKQLQADLSQARYDVLLDSVGDGLVAVDEKGIIQFVNTAAVSYLGLNRRELLGNAVSSTVLLKNERGSILRSTDYPLMQVLQSGKKMLIDQTSKEKYWMLRHDGSSFIASFIISPVVIESKNVGAIMLFHDLTDLNYMERAKSEFVSLASHQLRTPLNVISWYSEKLASQKKGTLNKKQTEYVHEINESNDRMIRLVSDLLNVSRVDLDRVKVRHEKVKVVALLRSLLKEVAPLIEEKKMRLSASLPSREVTLQDSDENLITVIMQNLLSNAIKYTDQSGKISVAIHEVRRGDAFPGVRVKAPKAGILLVVEDNGAGIPRDQQQKIFGKLFRADNVQVMDVAGTGLGLYVTRSFARVLNGDVWFVSSEGKGSTFYAYLPKA